MYACIPLCAPVDPALADGLDLVIQLIIYLKQIIS
jgi:hypothetical protein